MDKGDGPSWMPTSTSRRLFIAGFTAFLAVMVLVAGAFYLANSQRQYVIAQWERRLRISLADPMDKASQWLRAGKRALAEVAANETVKIYLSELEAAHFDKSAMAHGETQAAFVASYIASAAQDGPFAPSGPAARPGRLTPLATAGLALLDARGTLIASSPGFRPSQAVITYFMSALRRSDRRPAALVVGGHPTIVFFRPVMRLQAAGAPVGYVIGARDVEGSLGSDLSSALRIDGGRIILLARAGNYVRYLAASDMRDVPPATQELSLADDTGNLRAVARPGRLERAPDVAGQDALVFAETVDASPLVLIASVPTKTALAGLAQRERTLLTALLLAIIAMVAVAIAFNRHRTAAAAVQIAEASRREAEAIRSHDALLRAVVDAHPGMLLLLREGRTVALASARFAGTLGVDAESLVGKPLELVLPAGWREVVESLLEYRGDPRPIRKEFKASDERWQAATIVFLPETVDPSGGALLLIEDVTEAVRARESRAQVYRGIVTILLEAIDRRDPSAAAHSRRTAALARQMALRLGLPAIDVETAELAANLQGVSKLFLPEALLRKADDLDAEERRVIDDAAQHWLSLLGQISMDYPIARVSRAAHEIATASHIPETDPGVSRIAAIVAAANIFIALTSARAYRPALEPDAAIEELMTAFPNISAEILDSLRMTAGAPAPAI